MKKVLIFTNALGGIYNFRRELIEALTKNEYTVELAAPKSKPEYEDYFSSLGCVLIQTPLERRGMNPINDFSLLRYYRKLLKSRRPDVVLTYTIKPNIYGGIAARLSKTPYIANITGIGSTLAEEGGGIMMSLIIKLYAFGLKKATCVFFQNQDNRKFMTKKNIGAAKNRLIPGSGVNLQKFTFAEYPEEGSVKLLFVGRIMKEKGVDELFGAAEIIRARYPEVVFNFVGAFHETYEARVKDLEAKGILIYHGQQKNVHKFMTENHAVINPSYHEGMSNVLLESAATGRPVLASMVPGCRQTFDEGISGLGFEAKNTDSLVKTIERFIALPYEQKKAMGLAGRQKMEREFDRNIVINAYLEELKKATEGNQ